MNMLAFVLAMCVTVAALGAIRTETVEYKAGDATLKGFVAYDDALQDRRPSVLIVHEWWGLNDYPKQRARQLAELGYVAFAVDIYGDGQTTDDPGQAGALAGKFRQDRQLTRQRMTAALQQLTNRSDVDPQKVAAIGYCFGGTVALDFAMSGADLAAVVSFHGSLGGLPLDEAKNIKAAVLILNGAEDAAVPAKDKQALMEALTRANVDWQLIEYGGAVHTFTNPAADKLNMKNVAYHEKADKRSWKAMLQLFDERLGPVTTSASR